MATLIQLKAERATSTRLAKKYHAQWAAQYKVTELLLKEVKVSKAPDTAKKKYNAALQVRFALWKKWQKEVNDLVKINKEIKAKTPKFHWAVSDALALKVASLEGGQSSDGLFHPYQDAVHVWTIGYGHTAADGAPIPSPSAHPLTRAEAETLLLHDINVYYAPAVAKAFKEYGWTPTQKQFDALVSFAYNLGDGYFTRDHSVGAALASHNVKSVASAILLYDTAGGEVLPGLKTRREWESNLFLGGNY